MMLPHDEKNLKVLIISHQIVNQIFFVVDVSSLSFKNTLLCNGDLKPAVVVSIHTLLCNGNAGGRQASRRPEEIVCVV